jgi:hypothetical protein
MGSWPGAGADDYYLSRLVLRNWFHGSRRFCVALPDNFTCFFRVKAGILSIDKQRHRVSIADDVINLTPLEFDLFYFLAKNRGRVFSREQLMETVWGYDFYGDVRTVDTHIKKLRKN